MAEHTTVTPSGFQIVFEDGLADPETGTSKRRAYMVNGETLPSVTTVLGVMEKAGLKFAAEKLTVAACLELARTGELPESVMGTLSRMKSRGLRFYQIWDSKKDRGTLAHEDLVALAAGDPLKPLESYPVSSRKVLQGVADWFATERPEVLASEVMVASLAYGFAGRFDLLARLPRRDVVARVDLKSTEELPRKKSGDAKPPYGENLAQLALYEVAAVESGYAASDVQAVLRVDASGAWDFHVTETDPRVGLAAVELYRALRGLPEIGCLSATTEGMGADRENGWGSEGGSRTPSPSLPLDPEPQRIFDGDEDLAA